MASSLPSADRIKSWANGGVRKVFDVEILNSIMEGAGVAEQYFSAGLGL
jgi:hypothetical protein